MDNIVNMSGASSKGCELNCQCSGLITDSFKINSGNNATQHRREQALTNNYKTKMRPHSLNFASPKSSPTPVKRRVLGDIQNSPQNSPSQYKLNESPLSRSKLNESPSHRTKLDQPFVKFNQSPFQRPSDVSPQNWAKLHDLPRTRLFSVESPLTKLESPLPRSLESPLSKLNERPTTNSQSPLRSERAFIKRSRKISRLFEERTRFKMDKENALPMFSEKFVKYEMEEEARDIVIDGRYECFKQQTVSKWSMTKLDFTDALQKSHAETMQKSQEETMQKYHEETNDFLVPCKEMDEPDLESLQDLEQEFEADNFDQCNKYEIISTDSPDIISRGRSSSRKITARNLEFGAPLLESENSTSFNKQTTNRALNFEESFEFTSPATKKCVGNLSVKKSLKFTETPKKLSRDNSESSIGTMSSPASSRNSLFPSESTTSMESGFMSEIEEPFLDLEEVSSSPKVANFTDLLSSQINEGCFLKRPRLNRSVSLSQASKTKVSLFAIEESPKKGQKRPDLFDETGTNKRRKSNCVTPTFEEKRPILKRAFSENNASIMSALARSVVDPDLIGDFSSPFVLPLTSGDHSDLKSISCDTLASLLNGEFDDTVCEYQVIDCRYPYEYEGGHILGAVNMYTPSHILKLVNKPLEEKEDGTKRSILVFHCEFSLERGPKLSRFLRSSDRAQNKENYPSLHYPEVYLLHEGYRKFFQLYPNLCTPIGYTAMLDPRHTEQLKRHRSVQQPSTSNPNHTHRKHRLLL